MNKIFTLIAPLVLFSLHATAEPPPLPPVTHYSLHFRLSPKGKSLEAVATMTVENKTGRPVAELPFLLYRLLDVRRVSDDNGAPLRFEQTIVKLEDSNLQASLVTARLPSALAPGATTRVTIDYRGSIFGYPEVMSYVRDRVDEKYSLIRPDALAYPVLAGPTFASLRKAAGVSARFTYDVAVTVPDGYTVASGGTLTPVSTREGFATFAYKSR